jgi:hypothetical protein
MDAQRQARGHWPIVAGLMACAGTAVGQPKFTVANGGPSGLLGSNIYRTIGGVPVVAWPGSGMGCGLAGDDIVAISARKTATAFVACSSVDPTSVGVFQGPPPIGLPGYSVWDQSGKRQHAGDLWFMSKAFDRATGIIPGASLPVEQMYLAVNQASAWAGYFGLLPAGGPEVMFPPGTPMDDIDGVVPEPGVPKIYFCLRATSPSLLGLVGPPPSGADIIFDPSPLDAGTEGVFAKATALGLVVGDQIDGLIVYDDQDDGVFDDVDTVIFSLGRGSPSLITLGATAADMLVVNHGSEATVQIFATADNWGLGPGDNIDDLDAVPLQGFSAYQTILGMIGNPAAKSVENGPIVTDPFKGVDLSDASAVQTALGLSVFGFGHQGPSGERVADDFTIPPGEKAFVTGFTFLAYQIGSGTISSPFQQYSVGIWSGPPQRGWLPDVMPYTTFQVSGIHQLKSQFAGIYRTTDVNPLGTDRAVFENECVLSNGIVLPPGTYWIDWQAFGVLPGGAWVPPVSLKDQLHKPGSNAVRLAPPSMDWQAVVDLVPQDLPFGVSYVRESPPPSFCYADCDDDGVLSINDFICFQTFFALGDSYADCDGDGALSIDDFICFQTFFAIGCDF